MWNPNKEFARVLLSRVATPMGDETSAGEMVQGDTENPPPSTDDAVHSRVWRQIEDSLVGQIVISILVVAVVGVGVLWNLPKSAIKSEMTPVARPVVSATGVTHPWSMFAPNPPRSLWNVEVHVTMADGADRVWAFPSGGPLIEQFSWYRWRKLKESVVDDKQIRAGVAQWVVRELTTPGERPVRVKMVVRTETLPPPGTDDPPITTVKTLYDKTLTSRP